jgi:sortase A
VRRVRQVQLFDEFFYSERMRVLGTKNIAGHSDQAAIVKQEKVDSSLGVRPRPANRGVSRLRAAGNLLVTAGLLMLLGIGGWYGYTQWSTAQHIDEVQAKFGPSAFEPALNSTPKPTIVPLPTPLPVLNPSKSIAAPAGVLLGNEPQAREDTSPPVRLHIPSVKIDSQVVRVGWKMIPAPSGGLKSEWEVADYAIGHHKGSANPGQVGNVVMSGHVDYKGEVFRELHRVNKGDEVIVYTEKGQYIYVVTDYVIVKEEGASEAEKRRNAAYMNPTPDRTLTMITCYPYGINTHRLIVIAKPYQSALSTQSEFSLR